MATTVHSLRLRLSDIVLHSGKRVDFFGDDDVLPHEINNISIDSRRINKGELFYAIKGDRFDGHEFIAAAQEKGACAAVISREKAPGIQNLNSGMPLIIVDDTLEALQNIAHFHRTQFKIPVMALTGSVGKTSTKEFTAAVLARKYSTLKSEKSFNNAIGIPLTLLKLRPFHEIAVLEMGTNHFGEIEALCNIAEPGYGLILNIAEAHLEFFGDLQGVLKAKLELFHGLREPRLGIYNSDDPWLTKASMPLQQKLTFGIEKDADVQGKLVGLDENSKATFSCNGVKIQLHVAGKHTVYNALAAAAIGLTFDVPMLEIKEGLESVESIADRMEMQVVGNIKIIADVYNSNLRSASAALVALHEMQPREKGKRIAVLADMLELGEFSEEAHRTLGERAAELGIDFIFTFGEEAKAISDAAAHSGVQVSIHFEDKKKLIHRLSQDITPGDIILVKGSRGMKMEDVVRGIAEKKKAQEKQDD